MHVEIYETTPSGNTVGSMKFDGRIYGFAYNEKTDEISFSPEENFYFEIMKDKVIEFIAEDRRRKIIFENLLKEAENKVQLLRDLGWTQKDFAQALSKLLAPKDS